MNVWKCRLFYIHYNIIYFKYLVNILKIYEIHWISSNQFVLYQFCNFCLVLILNGFSSDQKLCFHVSFFLISSRRNRSVFLHCMRGSRSLPNQICSNLVSLIFQFVRLHLWVQFTISVIFRISMMSNYERYLQNI